MTHLDFKTLMGTLAPVSTARFLYQHPIGCGFFLSGDYCGQTLS